MTNREFYNAIVNGTVGEAEVAFAKEAIEKLNARNAARKAKLTDKQKENLELRAAIAEKTEAGVQYTAAALAELVGATQAKVGYQARVLVENGYFEKGEVKVKGKGKVNGYTRTAKAYNADADADADANENADAE